MSDLDHFAVALAEKRALPLHVGFSPKKHN